MTKKTKIILALILIVSFFLRAYNFKSYYVFSHDQDIASWIIKDILVNGHIRLIGQETSSQGVFIGALFYYLQIPFYLLGKMNPLPSVFLPIILGVFGTFSIYFVFSKITNTKIGLIGAFIHAASALMVFIEREVAPTTPVILWSVWYLYSLYLIYKNDQSKGFILWAFLIGLVWHLNLALIILSPLIVLAFLYSKKTLNIKALFLGAVVLLITNLPFIVFEYRHNFSQTKSIYLSLTTKKDYVQNTSTGFSKLDRVMQLVNKNTMSIFSKNIFIRPSIIVIFLVMLFIYLVKIKKINYFWGTIFISWQILYILFFTLNSLNVSEYYFHGMNVIWILIASIGLSLLNENKVGKNIFITLAIMFTIFNLNYIFRYNSDKKGYIEKEELIKYIKMDSIEHGYPCISISYITNPGYDLGYRYLFWLEKMHINKPISGSPVYTIVFPHSLVNRIDKSFGSLGLIYPDYKRYNKLGIEESCRGENSNLTDPMLGYTQ